MALKFIKPRFPVLDTSIAKAPPKQADPELLTPEHQAWRRFVLRRAGYRCEAVEHGARCPNGTPDHRLIADHIVERKDGGAPLDPANGQALCDHHHALKTIAARAKRMAQG